jgi:NADPH:quinone reductase-like Zn-dependent oxidoreductase
MRAYQIVPGATSLEGLKQVQLPDPQPGPGEVMLRVRATSLNYRDQAVVKGAYFGGPVTSPQVPLSDGAGEVVALGPGVKRFAVGDRAAGIFSPSWISGPFPAGGRIALGAPPAPGTLAEFLVLPEHAFVHLPPSLSFEEAATLPCAGVTAWNALTVGRQVKPGDIVLVLGTGGVSILALQIARAAGATVVITSSSDEKLARARALGASIGINYKTTPEWGKAVVAATKGHGADLVVEVGGAGTLQQSIDALAANGAISLIGVLTQGTVVPHPLMAKAGTLRGLLVGSRALFEDLNTAIEANRIKPVIDKVFPFEQAVEAYHYQASQQLFGKVVITV